VENNVRQADVTILYEMPRIDDAVLTDFANAPMRVIIKALRRAVLRTRCAEAQRWRCCYCQTPLTVRNLTLDHYIPICRGGKDTYENSVASCKKCNAEKGEQTAIDFMKSKSLINVVSYDGLYFTNLDEWSSNLKEAKAYKNARDAKYDLRLLRECGIAAKLKACCILPESDFDGL
jgi:CRISPR/Cas system Type II protein with McrA/HNH and RuvC-like nuclease domain